MNRIKQIRTEAKLTQEELANKMGTTKQYISELEKGARDIKRIRDDTMQRLCKALECTPEDIIIPTTFEYDNEGRLIVEKIYTDLRCNGYLFNISGEPFILNFGESHKIDKKTATGDLLKPAHPSKFTLTEKSDVDEIGQWLYVFLNCVPRDGFDVNVGRAITPKEFEELKEKYGLTEEKISNEFVMTIGAIYGKQYMKTITVIQIEVSSLAKSNPIEIESDLKAKGIEADNVNADRVNIRVK